MPLCSVGRSCLVGERERHSGNHCLRDAPQRYHELIAEGEHAQLQVRGGSGMPFYGKGDLGLLELCRQSGLIRGFLAMLGIVDNEAAISGSAVCCPTC